LIFAETLRKYEQSILTKFIMIPWISAIILAAGESTRMGGSQKLLMPLGNSTIIEQTIDNFLNSSAKEIVIVIGFEANELIRLIGKRPVTIAENIDYHGGMSTSIICGLKSVSTKAQGILLALADEPFITSPTINCLIDKFAAYKKGVVIPVYQGQRGHPVIFASKYKKQLLALKGDNGGKHIIAENSEDVLEVDIDCDGIVTDIDTLENYNCVRGKSI
jgi:molybdenum cofactor cytidylyltransferase